MVAQVAPQLVQAEEVKLLLQEHLTAGIIRIGRQWHIQTRGIPQVRPRYRASTHGLPLDHTRPGSITARPLRLPIRGVTSSMLCTVVRYE